MKKAQAVKAEKRPRQKRAGKPWAGQVVGGTSMPKWADHCVALLADGFLGFRKETVNAHEVNLSVWSDCGGMGTELSALTQLVDSVMKLTNQKLTITNFCFCDKKPQCRQFARVNHQPLHMSSDIFDRDFENLSFRCIEGGVPHAFPPKIDLHACCFPCGPWSMKGVRLGFSDRDGEIELASRQHDQQADARNVVYGKCAGPLFVQDARSLGT